MKAKDLLSDPPKWTQGAYARVQGGDPCRPSNTHAARFCLVGATMAAYSPRWQGEAYCRAITRIAEAAHIPDSAWVERELELWNDDPSRTFAEVQKVLEIADV